jgi:cardiolipin synthase
MSLLKHPIKNKINLRNHRKMIIIDNFSVVSGGINISSDYLSQKIDDNSWTDLSFIINGTATLHYCEIFKYDWESQTDKELVIKKHKNRKQENKSIIQVVPSGPDVDNDALYEAILYALFLAKKRVWIISPYFVPDGALMDALIIAKHRGIDIKLILPQNSDQILADISRSGFLRDLQKEGIEILLYKPKMLHAKAMLIDDDIAMIGSSNFDARSFFYNFEVMSFLYSKKDIIEVEKWVKTLFDECHLGLKPAGKIRIVFENFFKMLSPAL